MGSSVLPVIALVILVSSGAYARKCYTCVHATGVDLSQIDPALPVTPACSTGSGIPALFEKECGAADPTLNVIRQTINAVNPQIGENVNSILDQLSAKMAKNPKQVEYACAALDFSMTLKLEGADPMAITATGRTCIEKVAGEIDASICERRTGKQLVDELKQIDPTQSGAIDNFVKQITAFWPTFLQDSIGVCVCESDLCTKKAPAASGNGSGVMEVFTPLTIIFALSSMILFRN